MTSTFQITVTGREGKSAPLPAAWDYLGLEPGPDGAARFTVATASELTQFLNRARHPSFTATYRLQDADGQPASPVIHYGHYSDGWAWHKPEGTPYFINEAPTRPGWKETRSYCRFELLERGAGTNGFARECGKAKTLLAALDRIAATNPSTPTEILAGAVTCYGERDERKRDELAAKATPGTALWKMPHYGENGYEGLGEPVVAAGLGVNRIESLFGDRGGSGLGCWLVRYRTEDGRIGQFGPTVFLYMEEAARAWWVTDGRGNLVTGGHPDRDVVALQAAERGGYVQQGLAQGDEAAAHAAAARGTAALNAG